MSGTTEIKSGGLVTFDIKVDGDTIPDVIEIQRVVVEKSVNRISKATIVITDGNPATEGFTVSSSKTFVPGNKVRIEAGYESVNELIFEQLEEQHQLLVAEEAITSIVYDIEKDKISLKRGDVGITKRGAFSGILKKYGPETYEVVQESVKTLYNTKKEEAEV